MAEKPEAFENLKRDVFKALENQKRRDILRLIGERKGISFTEVLSASEIADSPTHRSKFLEESIFSGNED